MKMNLKLNTTDETVILDEIDQTLVYEFYRKHQLIERLMDYIKENGIQKLRFRSEAALDAVIDRILNLQDDYHISESEAINQVLSDKSYIDNYTF